MKIGVMFGSPETTTLVGMHLNSTLLFVWTSAASAPIKDKEETVVGNQTRVKVVKNKMAPAIPSG
jgi:recombination protein RecA